MEQAYEKFLRYIKIDTQSQEDCNSFPSTAGQWELARLLAAELREMGATEVCLDEHGYVYATIPATVTHCLPVLGFIAHMDTAPAFSGAEIKPQIIRNYDGGTILLNASLDLSMSSGVFPDLKQYQGQDLIVTDGTTLLGADDKAGIAEIMAMAEYLLTHPEILHGTIKVGFTPDEEVGRGADFFPVEQFGADVAFTVDGGQLGELEYENFNAASARITIHGANIHPGTAKGKMKNALLIGMELQSMLPPFENPMYTEGYEGFFHLDRMQGTVEKAELAYIIRDHSQIRFEERKQRMQIIVDYLNQVYGAQTVCLEMKDSYYNMKEKIEPHLYLIELAKSAMRDLQIEPAIQPIRGGTDGSRLSFMGLPCPNLCSGGHNFHGKYEFISIQSMEEIVCLLVKITEKLGQKS